MVTIGIATVAAILGFVIMFAVRYFIAYIFYTPEALVHNETESTNEDASVEEERNQQFIPQNNRTTAEFEDENTEEVPSCSYNATWGRSCFPLSKLFGHINNSI